MTCNSSHSAPATAWIDNLMRSRYSELLNLERDFGEWGYRFTASIQSYTATHRASGASWSATSIIELRREVAADLAYRHYASEAALITARPQEASA